MTIANPHRTRLTILDGDIVITRFAADRQAGELPSASGSETVGLHLAGAADEAARG